MQFIKFFLVFTVPIVPTCFAGIMIKTCPSDKHSKLADVAIEILTSCYRTRGNAVVIAGNSVGNIARKRWFRLHFSVTLLDTRDIRNGPVARDASHKLQVFVVTASSSKILISVLKVIKNSPWWNHMASVLILDWSDSPRGCAKAFAILKGAWKMNLIHAKFMCLDRANRALLYSYNPYTSRAPHPWNLVATYKPKHDHPWALFAQVYRQGAGICEELDFEKRGDLDGYAIRAIVKNISGVWTTHPNKNGTDAFGNLDGKIARLLFYALNATPKVDTHSTSYSILPFIRDNKTVGGDVDIMNGIFDMGLNARFPQANATQSYPIRESGIVVMTQYRGHISQLAKIAAVIDRSSRIGLCLVALITMIFFKCTMRQGVMPAFLNVWRTYCNLSVPKIPTTQAARLYLTGLYLLMINIQGIYQGKMAALVTKDVAIPDVHTMHDIAKHGLTIYGGNRYAYLFSDLSFTGRYVIIDGANCTENVLNDYGAACVHEKHLLTHEAAELKQHVSSEFIVKFYRMYIIRPDWPLEGRINTVLARLMESGLVLYSDMEDTQKISRILKHTEDLHNNHAFKIMTLPDLRFAFSILGIGLTFATASFIVEIRIGTARPKITSRRICVQSRVR